MLSVLVLVATIRQDAGQLDRDGADAAGTGVIKTFCPL